MVGLALRADQVEAQEAMKHLTAVAGSKVSSVQRNQPPRTIAGLLGQLAARAFLWRLAGVERARGDLQEYATSGLPVLAHQHQSVTIQHRHHCDGAAMLHDLAGCRPARGQGDGIHSDMQQPSLVDRL